MPLDHEYVWLREKDFNLHTFAYRANALAIELSRINFRAVLSGSGSETRTPIHGFKARCPNH
jgi:hypothetical protein